MPELPEVEVSRRGLLPDLLGRSIVRAVLRVPGLRHVIDPTLAERLAGLRLVAIERRGKYLLFDCESAHSGGWLILHLGMSGSLRLVPPGTVPQKHDHFDLVFMETVMRYRDPRRFGALLWHEGLAPENHPALRDLGLEPLGDDFNGHWLYSACRQRKSPIKPLLMNSHFVVGVGNIYASESLFAARIAPWRPAASIDPDRCGRLADAIRSTLESSIAAGGSSVRDYVHSDGGAGCFQLACAVYDRTGLPCPVCGAPVQRFRQAGRSSFYCANCQH